MEITKGPLDLAEISWTLVHKLQKNKTVILFTIHPTYMLHSAYLATFAEVTKSEPNFAR